MKWRCRVLVSVHGRIDDWLRRKGRWICEVRHGSILTRMGWASRRSVSRWRMDKALLVIRV